MSTVNDNSFGSNWDLGGFVVEQLISYPINKLVNRELRKAGIDPNSLTRKALAIGTSIYGSIIGSILGGPIGFFTGLLSYVGVSGYRFPGDKPYYSRDLEEACALKSAEIATKILKENVSYQTWNNICDSVQEMISRYRNSNISAEEALTLLYDAIANVNSNAAEQWGKVFRASVREFQRIYG